MTRQNRAAESANVQEPKAREISGGGARKEPDPRLPIRPDTPLQLLQPELARCVEAMEAFDGLERMSDTAGYVGPDFAPAQLMPAGHDAPRQ